jgi:hypothetical protein
MTRKLGVCRRIEYVTRASEKFRIKAEAIKSPKVCLKHIESDFLGDNAEPAFCSWSQ